MNYELTRGLRLNNPGNIRHGRSHWQGASADQPDREFVKFDSLVMGFRAMWIVLNNYWYVHGCHNLHSVICRWAPHQENNTRRYMEFVSGRTKIGITQQLRPPDKDYAGWEPILQAMVRMEGNSYPDQLPAMRDGYRRAFGVRVGE